MGDEAGRFDFDSIACGIAEKMIARHPHIFGEAGARDIPELHKVWEEQKAAERAAKPHSDASALADVPLALPALSRAQKLQKRARRVGFDWPDAQPVLTKLREELETLRSAS